MKYKAGDKVRYESGEWWFYGTVTAAIESSINPCYRLSVDRMEKKNCKFSITQFEFELEADNELEADKGNRKWENVQEEYYKKISSIRQNDNLQKTVKPESTPAPPVPVPELKPKEIETPQEREQAQEQEAVTPKQSRKNSWNNNYEAYRNGAGGNLIHTWMYQNRKQYEAGTLKEERLEKLIAINFPFEAQKRGAKKKK